MKLIKVFGIIAIITSFSAIGIIKSLELVKRAEILRQFIKAIETARDSIVYTSSETFIVFDLIKKKFPNLNENNFAKQDRNFYINFLENLGNSSTEGQVKFCNGLISDVSRNLMEADKDRDTKSKLYTTLGVCAGISVSIILI